MTSWHPNLHMDHSTKKHTYLVDGIPTPLKNMSSSVGIIIPNYGTIKHVPNQPEHCTTHRVRLLQLDDPTFFLWELNRCQKKCLHQHVHQFHSVDPRSSCRCLAKCMMDGIGGMMVPFPAKWEISIGTWDSREMQWKCRESVLVELWVGFKQHNFQWILGGKKLNMSMLHWGMKKILKTTAFNGIHRPVRLLCIIQILVRSPLGVLHPTLFAGYSSCPANLLLWNLPKLVCLKNRVTPNSHMCISKIAIDCLDPSILGQTQMIPNCICLKMYTPNPLVDHQLSDDMVILWVIP